MKIKYKRQFSKDLDELPTIELKAEVAAVIRTVEAAASLSDVTNVKKLKGYKTAYRIRVGDFRIGLVVENNEVSLVRVINRRDIYRLFP